MARPRATSTTAASSKPKAKPKSRSRAKPKVATPSPVSLLSSGVSSPSSACRTPSPAAAAAADLSFRLSPSSPPPAKPGTRNSTPLASPATAMSTIGDLRSLAASHLDSLKRRIDALHGDCVRDLEASQSRISKRVKMQSHGCLQLAEEVDKEQKKMADKIAERAELVKTSYKKFVAEVQASTSRGTLQTETIGGPRARRPWAFAQAPLRLDLKARLLLHAVAIKSQGLESSEPYNKVDVAQALQVSWVTVPEMAKSAERAIDGLRSRYNISATPSA